MSLVHAVVVKSSRNVVVPAVHDWLRASANKALPPIAQPLCGFTFIELDRGECQDRCHLNHGDRSAKMGNDKTCDK